MLLDGRQIANRALDKVVSHKKGLSNSMFAEKPWFEFAEAQTAYPRSIQQPTVDSEPTPEPKSEDEFFEPDTTPLVSKKTVI